MAGQGVNVVGGVGGQVGPPAPPKPPTPAAPPDPAMAALLASLSGGGGGATSGTGGSGLPPHIGAGPTTPKYQVPGAVADIKMADRTGANAAIFGTAKDQVGKTGAGALTGLRDSLGARGMLGSGIEARGAEQLAEAGQGQLGEVSRQQAITDADISQRTAEANYAGGITQRGQTIGAETTTRGQDMGQALGYRGQDVTQRGQDIDARGQDINSQTAKAQQNQNVLLGLLSMFKPPANESLY